MMAAEHPRERRLVNISLTRFMLFFAVICFSGAYIEQWIFGAGFDRNISFSDRILNTSKFFPVYLYFILGLFRNPRAFRINVRDQMPIFLFAGYYILSSAWSMDYMFSLINGVIFLCTVLTAWGITATVRYEKFVVTSFYAFMVIAVGSIVYILFLPSYGLMKGVDQETFTNLAGLPQGVFKHKSRLAEVMSVGVIIAFFSKGYVKQTHRYFLAALCLYLLLSTEASLKTVGLFGSIGLMMVWEFFIRVFKERLISSIMVSIAFIVPALVFIFFVQAILLASGEDMTLTGRTIIWQHAFDVAMREPFLGYGPSSIWNSPLGHVDELPLFRIPHAHNTFLEMFLQSGLIGMSLIFSFLFISIRLVLYGRSEINSRSRIAFLVLWSGLARSAFEFGLFQGNNLSFLFMLIVISYQVVQKADQASVRQARLSTVKYPMQYEARA